jgi:pimeloyl-ACP methyl ester carboxylesterase
MVDFRVGKRLSSYVGPIAAVEAQGTEYPIMASKVIPGATRTTIPGVSHWLMMDDPDAFGRALDPFIGFARR